MATIPFADVLDWVPLPIDAQDIVTRTRIVIAGNRAGPQPSTLHNFEPTGDFPTVNQALSYAPLPLTYRYVSDSTIRAERSFSLPDGVTPFLPPEHGDMPEPSIVSGFTNAGDPSAVRDGDSGTFASTSSGGHLEYSLAKAVGFRLTYTAEETGSAAIILNPSVAPVTTWVTYDLAASSTPVEMEAVMLLDARTASDNTGSTPILPSPPFGHLLGRPSLTRTAVIFQGGAVKVYEFYPLIPDETLLESIAVSNLKLPASEPKRVTVAGYVAPDKSHTITGWPGGDFTGVVAQHQYEREKTIIDFEEAGAPTGMPFEAVEAERARRSMVASAISDANYGLKMGERQ